MKKSKRILVVEPDIRDARELFCLFSDEDYDLELSRSFAEAVPVIKTIDSKIQIIVTANRNTKELEAKVRNQDIFYYYIKSFDRRELKLAVRGVFEKLGRIKESWFEKHIFE